MIQLVLKTRTLVQTNQQNSGPPEVKDQVPKNSNYSKCAAPEGTGFSRTTTAGSFLQQNPSLHLRTGEGSGSDPQTQSQEMTELVGSVDLDGNAAEPG